MIDIKRLEYEKLGVDPKKSGVEHLKRLISDVLKSSFTPLVRDPTRREYITLHVDSAGSKPLISYLWYGEFGESKYFRGIAQDVVAMNLDDIVTVGAEPVAFADYVGLNPFRIPKEVVLEELSIGFSETFNTLSKLSSELKFNILPLFSGGETAEIPDQVRTIDVVGMVYGRVEASKALEAKVKPGDLIVGFRSGGRARYENYENSGIMCNGLTLARHVLLDRYYKDRYGEAWEDKVKYERIGRYRLDSYVEDLGMCIGEALLSPTRIFIPIVGRILEDLRGEITGMAHITGGGFTKLLNVGEGVHYIINNPLSPDPIFQLIQSEGRIGWEEMFQVFNMGVGFVGMFENTRAAEEAIEISESYNVEAEIIGYVEKGGPAENRLTIKFGESKLYYSKRIL